LIHYTIIHLSHFFSVISAAWRWKVGLGLWVGTILLRCPSIFLHSPFPNDSLPPVVLSEYFSPPFIVSHFPFCGPGQGPYYHLTPTLNVCAVNTCMHEYNGTCNNGLICSLFHFFQKFSCIQKRLHPFLVSGGGLFLPSRSDWAGLTWSSVVYMSG